MCFPGMPSVFYGDELGITGILEADYRSPMPWQGGDTESLAFYKRAIALRRTLAPLQRASSAPSTPGGAAASSPSRGSMAASA